AAADRLAHRAPRPSDRAAGAAHDRRAVDRVSADSRSRVDCRPPALATLPSPRVLPTDRRDGRAPRRACDARPLSPLRDATAAAARALARGATRVSGIFGIFRLD